MRMIYLLINKVKLKVRVGRSLGEKILTKIGVAQGDCLSILLFIFYLVQFVDVIPGLPTREDFGNNVLRSELDWLIDRNKMNQIKRLLLDLLQKGNLTENESKREEFRIPDEKFLSKKCKCLGSLMDTKSDINRRKFCF